MRNKIFFFDRETRSITVLEVILLLLRFWLSCKKVCWRDRDSNVIFSRSKLRRVSGLFKKLVSLPYILVIFQLPYYAYLYDKAVPEVTIKVKPRPPTSTAMATAALAAAMANANAFTIVYPTKTTGTNKITQKSSTAKITSQMETSPALTKPLINESKKAKFTRRQTEYFNSSRIPSLNRRNSLYMPELEPFETVIALENSPAVAPRQQRLSSIISNDDETEAALGKKERDVFFG